MDVFFASSLSSISGAISSDVHHTLRRYTASVLKKKRRVDIYQVQSSGKRGELSMKQIVLPFDLLIFSTFDLLISFSHLSIF